MARKQVAADPQIDYRSDIYAAGVLAYEMLAGRPPFGGESPQRVLAAQVMTRPESLGRLRPELPPALVSAVIRCLSNGPADRRPSPGGLRRAARGTCPTRRAAVPGQPGRVLAWRTGAGATAL